jgi:hypothetical protein
MYVLRVFEMGIKIKHIPHQANLFARSAKQILTMWLVSEKNCREKVGSVPTSLLFARTDEFV